jgi:hypothetical protein
MISFLGMKPVKDVKEEWAIGLKEITRCKLVLILESANGRKFLNLFVSFTASLKTFNVPVISKQLFLIYDTAA